MVYEPFKLKRQIGTTKKYCHFLASAHNLRRMVIRLVQLHADSGSCEHSSCFADPVDAYRRVADLISFCEYLHARSRGDRVYCNVRHFRVLKHRFFVLADRAYRSSLRHGYTTAAFLRALR